MAVLFVYFNPCNYSRIKQNALTVKHQMDSARIPYFIAEMKHDSDPSSHYLFQACDTVCQYSSDSYMFYKENLIAATVPMIPAQYTKLCILDFDILFDCPDWYSVVSSKLDSVQVTQPFTEAHFLDLDFTVWKTKTNCVDNRVDEGVHYSEEHTGFVWAFRMDWFRAYSFDDRMVSTMGDNIMACNITKRDRNAGYMQSYFAFSGEALWAGKVDYGSCPLSVYHMSHGLMHNRQYVSIRTTLNQAIETFKVPNSAALFERRGDRILEWAPAYKSEMNRIFMNYFRTRDDDATQ